MTYQLHGHAGASASKATSEYNAYRHAKARCTNPRDPKWRLYGGRGIKFLFPNYAAFLTDIGRKPSPHHVLDREDNNKHYQPGNVRWVTHSVSMLNRRPYKRLIP